MAGGASKGIAALSGASVALSVAGAERVRAPSSTASIVVAAGMPGPLSAWPGAKGSWALIAWVPFSVASLERWRVSPLLSILVIVVPAWMPAAAIVWPIRKAPLVAGAPRKTKSLNTSPSPLALASEVTVGEPAVRSALAAPPVRARFGSSRSFSLPV